MGNCNCNCIENKKQYTVSNLKPVPELSKKEIEIIKLSWKKVMEGDLKEHGACLMIRVFIEHKEIKHLWSFASDLHTRDQMQGSQALKTHGEKLLSAVDMIINTIDDLNTIKTFLITLGHKHFAMGVKPEYFPYLGEALISTIQDILKNEFNESKKKAWKKLFTFISSSIIAGIRAGEENKIN